MPSLSVTLAFAGASLLLLLIPGPAVLYIVNRSVSDGREAGLSAVAENIIALHLAALRSENHRLMTILKSRDRRTDMRMRRFEIHDGGIVLDENHERAERILRDISSQGPQPTPAADLKLTGV